MLRGFASVVLLAVIVTACGGVMDPPTTLPSGEGWAVLSVAKPGRDRWQLSTATERTGSFILVVATVPAGGGDGCGAPTIRGVREKVDAKTIEIDIASDTQTPPPGNECVVVSNADVTIRIDLAAYDDPASIEMSLACEWPGCSGRPVAIPAG